MKKILSVLLALLMMLSSLTMLVSATTPDNGDAGANDTPSTTASGTTGHIFYSQNFDAEELKDKTGNDLLTALGWTTTEAADATFEIVDGKMHIVPGTTDYTALLATDRDMVGGAITVEYDFTFGATSADASYLSVNIATDDKNFVRATPITAKGIIDVSGLVTRSGAAENIHEKLVTDEAIPDTFPDFLTKTHTMKCVIDPNSDGVQIQVDGVPLTHLIYANRVKWNNYGESNSISSVIGDTLNLVATAGLDITIDNLRVFEYAAALQITEIMANARQSGAYQWLEIYNPTDAPANMYDFCVVIYNGCTNPGGYIGDEKDNPSGTKVTYKKDKDGNVIKVTEHTYNAWDKDAASVVGYFTPGSKKMLVKPEAQLDYEKYNVFDSPAYEDGVIAPGETAIVLLPYTAVQGGKSVTDEAFRDYLTSLGAPADIKTFICENEYSKCGCDNKTYCPSWQECDDPFKYPFRIIDETNESCLVALMRVENTATAEDIEKGETYKPVGIGVGKPNSRQFAYYENYVAMSSKPATSGTTVVGFMVQALRDVVDENLPVGTIVYEYDENGKQILDEKGNPLQTVITEPVIIPNQKVYSDFFGLEPAAFTAADDKSFEISYNRIRNEGRTQKMGRLYYNATAVRVGADGRERYYTPGFIPPAMLNGTAMDATLPDGTCCELITRSGKDYVYDGEVPYGYEYVGMKVNGEDDVVSSIPGEQLYNGHDTTVELVFKRLIPEMIGYQVSEVVDGKYSIRVIGKTSHIMCQSLGFRIEMEWKDIDQGKVNMKYDRECFYVYDSLTVNGEIVTAEELGAEKLYAYTIGNIPAGVKNMTFSVTPYYIKSAADSAVNLAKDQAQTYLVNEGVIFDIGNYENHKDQVEFGYDKSAPTT